MATRWGIVSAGKISNDFCHALKLLPSAEHEIIAVAAGELDRAKAFAEKLSIPKSYGSYEELAQDTDVDVVYIGSINTSHKEHCLLMIKHGKHVLCEKPSVVNQKELKEVLDAARASNVFFMEAVWSRFFPAYARIREEIQAGSIGEVRVVQATFCVPIKDVPRIRSLELAGGALLDLGIYTIQFALMAFGGEKPEKVIATGHLMDTGVDEWESITLLYKNGRMAVLTVSSSTNLYSRGVIIGTKGTLEVPHPFWCPTQLITLAETIDFPIPYDPTNFNYVNSPGLGFQAAASRQSILEGKRQCDLMSHADSENIMAIMDEVRRQLGYHLPQDD